jgi:hypothetical protein
MVRELDAEYLAELRDYVRADLAEREANRAHARAFDPEANGAHEPHFDPEVEHDIIMAATRPSMPEIVHKTTIQKDTRVSFSNNGDDTLTFTDDQVEQLADVLAQYRLELQAEIDDAIAPLRERIAVLEGQLAILASLLSEGRSFKASETIRELQVQ